MDKRFTVKVVYPDGHTTQTSPMSKAQADWVATEWQESNPDAVCEVVEARRYQHDCNLCKFMGQYDEYDLYYCNSALGGETVIARWGNDGPDYHSGLALAEPHVNLITGKVGVCEPLAAARLCARMLGLMA